jgi:hypothetical protein
MPDVAVERRASFLGSLAAQHRDDEPLAWLGNP